MWDNSPPARRESQPLIASPYPHAQPKLFCAQLPVTTRTPLQSPDALYICILERKTIHIHGQRHFDTEPRFTGHYAVTAVRSQGGGRFLQWCIKPLPLWSGAIVSNLEHFAFETLLVSTHHSGEKRGFRQNPRHFVATAAFAPAEQFQRKIALKNVPNRAGYTNDKVGAHGVTPLYAIRAIAWQFS